MTIAGQPTRPGMLNRRSLPFSTGVDSIRVAGKAPVHSSGVGSTRQWPSYEPVGRCTRLRRGHLLPISGVEDSAAACKRDRGHKEYGSYASCSPFPLSRSPLCQVALWRKTWKPPCPGLSRVGIQYGCRIRCSLISDGPRVHRRFPPGVQRCHARQQL